MFHYFRSNPSFYSTKVYVAMSFLFAFHAEDNNTDYSDRYGDIVLHL